MALFKGADESLPLLTQFYQVNMDQDELKDWLMREWPQRTWHGGDWVQVRKEPVGGPEEVYRRAVVPMVDFHTLIQRVMDEGVDLGEISRDDLVALQGIARERAADDGAFIIRETDGKMVEVSQLPPHNRVPLDRLEYHQVMDSTDQAFIDLRREMADQLVRALSRNPTGLQRCPICKSVFLATDSNRPRVYCSKRCTDRAASRSYYDRKKSGRRLVSGIQ